MTPDTLHREVDELLPWFANGTLEGEERARVERHLTECNACRSEMALLQDVGEAAAEIVSATPPVADSLGKTFARIDEWEQSKPLSFGARVRQFLLAPWPMPRLVLAGQAALIVLLGAGLFMSRTPEREFTTASGGGEAVGARLTVTFEPTATEESLRQALRAVNATIVSGPSAAGVYVVALPADTPDSAVDSAIDALRKNTSVISFVEREP
jgi:anti-sigma factor RsiW